MRRIVLAYSGDLESSVAILWLTERYGAEVVTLTLDLGQAGDLTDVRERALAAGAIRAHVLDAREELVRDFITPALQAGAFSGARDPFVFELGQALVAKRLVEVAAMESADAVAHGAGNERAALVSSLRTLLRRREPRATVLSPACTWGMSRPDAVEYARARGVAIPSEPAASVNLWGRSVKETAIAPAAQRPENPFTMTRPIGECPEEGARLEIEFAAGVPVRANGIEMPMLELIESLSIIGGAHGVGRIEERSSPGGASARIVHESPAACLLAAAYSELARSVLPEDVNRNLRGLSTAYAALIREGRWFSPDRETADAFVSTVTPLLGGRVALALSKGTCQAAAADACFARTEEEVAS